MKDGRPGSDADRAARDAARRTALATRFRQLRMSRGLSAEQVAAAAGLDQRFYEDLEGARGDLGQLTPIDVMDLADAFGLTAADLLSDLPGEPLPPVVREP